MSDKAFLNTIRSCCWLFFSHPLWRGGADSCCATTTIKSFREEAKTRMSVHPQEQAHAAEQKQALELIEVLGLRPHPEGGYYKETFRAPTIDPDQRATCTAIYFLLTRGQSSQWHKVDAIETWLWHAGNPPPPQLHQTKPVLRTPPCLSFGQVHLWS